MKINLNQAQARVLHMLKKYKCISYYDLEMLTGMSRSGIRGRIAELRKKGFKIEPVHETDTTQYWVKYTKEENGKEPNPPLSRPITHGDMVTKRIETMDTFTEIADFLDNIKTYKVKPIKVTQQSDKHHVLLVLSDSHFGETITDTDTGSIVFDTKIAKARMNQLTYKTLQHVEHLDSKIINICILGDIVDGDMIYKNHTFYIEKAAIEQVQDAVVEITKMINQFIKHKFKVNVYCVRGNHGITNYKNLEEDNWDNVAYKMLEIGFANNKDVSITHFQASEGKTTIGNRSVVLLHGENLRDQIKTASGLRNFRGLCSKHNLKVKDLVMIGHLHTFGVEYDQGKILIRNGGIPDTSPYAMNLNLFSVPEQTLLYYRDNDAYPTIIPIELK